MTREVDATEGGPVTRPFFWEGGRKVARKKLGIERGAGWSTRPVTRKPGARPVRPVGYRLVVLPRTPQAEIDICLECPLPDCGRRGCPLKRAAAAPV